MWRPYVINTLLSQRRACTEVPCLGSDYHGDCGRRGLWDNDVLRPKHKSRFPAGFLKNPGHCSTAQQSLRASDVTDVTEKHQSPVDSPCTGARIECGPWNNCSLLLYRSSLPHISMPCLFGIACAVANRLGLMWIMAANLGSLTFRYWGYQ